MKREYTITSPGYLCLYGDETKDKTLSFFEELNSISMAKNIKSILMDFSNLVYISAAAANYLFAIVVYHQVNINNSLYSFKLPKDPKQRQLFADSGLHEAIKAGGLGKVKRLWRSNNFLCGNNSDVAKLLKVLKKRCGVSPLPEKLSLAIRETFLNIHHHAKYPYTSETPLTWFSYFYDSEDDDGRYLTITVQDLGQGIVESIRKAFIEYRDSNDSDCIEHAMTESVTSTHEKGRGKGSYDIHKPLIFNKNKGNDVLYVMSSKGSYSFEVSEQEEHTNKSTNLQHYIRGTLVEWTLYY
ncbi:hypothetical protein RV040_002419 [Vibrio alginolyticus]|nr:hypothetical protein [Vibrio alginolyticus]